MTKDEALQLALEALGSNRRTHHYCEDTWYSCPKHEDGCANDSEGDECNCGADKANAGIDQAITAIKEALETKDEPVAWYLQGLNQRGVSLKKETQEWKPLYTTPQSTWVGLTDEEKAQFVVAYYPSNWDRKTAVSLMSDYEKYLKEKNHG